MGSISRQFFALPNELIEITEEWKSEFNFILMVMQLFPETKIFQIAEFSELDELPIELEDIYCVFLGETIPNLDVKDRYDFLMTNPEFLTLDFGKFKDNYLRESWLSGMTDKPDIQNLWKKIGRQLAKKTKAGIWASDLELGGKQFYKDLSYTQGVEEFCRKGGTLVGDDTSIIFSIDVP